MNLSANIVYANTIASAILCPDSVVFLTSEALIFLFYTEY
jgi:hypothetical protein